MIFPSIIIRHRNLIVEHKIAIEFDGYYHFDTSLHVEYFKNRKEKIESEGWKFISYTMFDEFPNLDKIKKDIDNIMYNEGILYVREK